MKLLFVCLGNICRSPMAEGLFRKMAHEAGISNQIDIDSAGTSSYHIGEPPHRGVLQLGARLGIPFDGLQARQVTRDDFEKFDMLIAMDRSNLEALQIIGPACIEKIYLFLDFANLPEKNVHDPYFDGDFEKTYRQVEAGCRGLLAYIQRK